MLLQPSVGKGKGISMSLASERSVMDVYFLRVHARPAQQHPRYDEVRGAYVNCWVKASTPDDAQRIAFAEIASQHWTIWELENAPSKEFARTEAAAPCLLLAETDGECYVFHAYLSDDSVTAN